MAERLSLAESDAVEATGDVDDAAKRSSRSKPEETEGLYPIPRAMTISSFASLSVEPAPSVMFNISLPSHTFEAIASSRRFNVHILAGSERGAQLAARFARGHSRLDQPADINDEVVSVKNDMNWKIGWQGYVDLIRRGAALPFNPSRGIWARLSKETVPILNDTGVLYTLRCLVKPPRQSSKSSRHGIIELDDKTAIIVGQVEDFVYGGTLEDDKVLHPDHVSLSYAQRKYRKAEDAHLM